MKKYSSILIFLILFCFSCRPKLPSPQDQLGSESFNLFQINGEKVYASTSFGKLYMSTNEGKKWKEIGMKGEFKWNRSLYIRNNVLFLGTNEGLFRTSDDGATWNQIGNEDMKESSVNSIVENDQYLFASGVSDGIFRSSDHGDTWQTLDSGLNQTWIYSVACENKKLVALSNGDGFISYNNGNSFDTLATSDIEINPSTQVILNQNKIYLVTEEGQIFFSDSDGKTWAKMLRGVASGRINCLTFDGNYIYQGTDLGLFKSTDNGGNWDLCETGFEGSHTHRVNTVCASGENTWMGTDQGIYLSKDKGEIWKSVTKKPDYSKLVRHGQFRRNLFYFGLFLAWAILWITPLVLLAKVKNGYGIYFLNLVAGIIFIVGGMATYANQPTTGRLDFGNLGRAIMLIMLYGIWGLILLCYSLYRRYRHNRDQFHPPPPPPQ